MGLFSGRCARFEPTPAGTSACVEVESCGGSPSYLFLPVVMPWNFWLHRRWSVFAAPGLGLYLHDFSAPGLAPCMVLAGGHLRLSERLTLTLRLGYPSSSPGVSFLS